MNENEKIKKADAIIRCRDRNGWTPESFKLQGDSLEILFMEAYIMGKQSVDKNG